MEIIGGFGFGVQGERYPMVHHTLVMVGNHLKRRMTNEMATGSA